MVQDDRDPILILGAGIGGLTSAIALSRAGFRVEVFERARELREVGAGVALWSNAMAALQQIGMEPPVRQAGAPLDVALLLSWDGRDLGALPIQEVAQELGLPRSVGIHRPSLQKVLLEGCEGIPIHTDRGGVSFEDRGDRVVLRLADDSEVTGSLLIGADGVRSVVRAQLRGDDPEPDFTGSVAWRGIVESNGAVEPGISLTAWGTGRRIGIFEVDEERVCWYVVGKAPASQKEAPGVQERLVAHVAGCGVPIAGLIERTPEDCIVRSDLLVRPPNPVWGRGRVTLVGDSAHVMAPTLAQGAAQAIEDAVALARLLREASDPVQALRRYEELRHPRTRFLVEKSLMYQRIASWENPLAVRLRDTFLRHTPQSFRIKQTRTMVSAVF